VFAAREILTRVRTIVRRQSPSTVTRWRHTPPECFYWWRMRARHIFVDAWWGMHNRRNGTAAFEFKAQPPSDRCRLSLCWFY